MSSPDGALSGRLALWTLDHHCHRGTESGLGLYGPGDGGHGEVLLEVQRKRTNVVVFVPQRPQTDRTGTTHPEITVLH